MGGGRDPNLEHSPRVRRWTRGLWCSLIRSLHKPEKLLLGGNIGYLAPVYGRCHGWRFWGSVSLPLRHDKLPRRLEHRTPLWLLAQTGAIQEHTQVCFSSGAALWSRSDRLLFLWWLWCRGKCAGPGVRKLVLNPNCHFLIVVLSSEKWVWKFQKFPKTVVPNEEICGKMLCKLYIRVMTISYNHSICTIDDNDIDNSCWRLLSTFLGTRYSMKCSALLSATSV